MPPLLPLLASIRHFRIDRPVEAALNQSTPERAKFVTAIQHILAGERDDAVLCADLDYDDALIVRAILERIGG